MEIVKKMQAIPRLNLTDTHSFGFNCAINIVVTYIFKRVKRLFGPCGNILNVIKKISFNASMSKKLLKKTLKFFI